MHTKKVIGLFLLIAGIIIIFYAGYQRSRIGHARAENNQTTSMFQGNAAGGVYHGVVEGEISQYDRPVMMLMISGVVVAIIGGALVFFNRRKRHK